MRRLSLTLCALASLGLVAAPAFAAGASLTQEVHELRRDVQMQEKKIDALSAQILRLTQLLETAKTAPAPTPRVALSESTRPAPEPAPVAPLEPVVPKAEAVPPPVQHVVEKGETLTSIAKHYNIPLADLQKRNNITNDRKLQIGQTLLVPAVKPTSENKENP